MNIMTEENKIYFMKGIIIGFIFSLIIISIGVDISTPIQSPVVK
jgi:hypothetical protein